MVLKQLNILNYRNIAEAQLEFSPKINCLVGDNGEGKTNVLDSIFFLSFTKSAVGNQDSMNIKHGEEMMMIQGIYDLNGAEEEITCGMKAHQKKHVKRNKKEYKRLAEHIGLLPIIIVTPQDNEIISGGSEERRRLMDMVISQYDRDYMASLMAYNKALTQRNAMLKADEEPLEEVIGLYEEMMAEYGEKVYRGRQRFVEEFTPLFQKYYTIISGNNETVELKYISHCQRGPLLDVIQRDRFKDRAIGYSLHGIHRDDLEMTLGGFPIKREGSQGQNKTYAISLKLAQFNFLAETGNRTTPILLLDDIFDKLDANRVEQIVNLVSGPNFGQIFITDTSQQNLDKILAKTQGDYKIFNVKDGTISGA